MPNYILVDENDVIVMGPEKYDTPQDFVDSEESQESGEYVVYEVKEVGILTVGHTEFEETASVEDEE